MQNPGKWFLARCRSGFTVGQKVALSIGLAIYIISPIDLLPFFPVDDFGAIFALFKVLTSPTVTHTDDPPPSAAAMAAV